MTGLPGNLTTPPLTPPREERSQPLMATSEPINGNRNNVSDSVHANSASFKATVNVGVSNGVTSREQETEALDRLDTSSVTDSPSNLDAEPPALVIISDMEDEKEEGEEEAMDVSSEPTKPEEQFLSAEPSQCNGKTPPNKVYMKVSSGGGGGGKEEGAVTGSLQSTKVTSAGKDAVSSGEEELEEVDLEQDADKNMTQHGNFLKRPAHITTNNSANIPHPHSNASPADTKVDSPTKSASLPSHRAYHPTAVNVMKKHSKNGHTPSSVYATERKLREVKARESGGFQDHNRRETDVESAAPVTNVKQAAKVKQFFTTIQQHGNKLGSEVAEQVQELIHALMVRGCVCLMIRRWGLDREGRRGEGGRGEGGRREGGRRGEGGRGEGGREEGRGGRVILSSLMSLAIHLCILKMPTSFPLPNRNSCIFNCIEGNLSRSLCCGQKMTCEQLLHNILLVVTAREIYVSRMGQYTCSAYIVQLGCMLVSVREIVMDTLFRVFYILFRGVTSCSIHYVCTVDSLTLGTCQSVLIREVASFQGSRYLH